MRAKMPAPPQPVGWVETGVAGAQGVGKDHCVPRLYLQRGAAFESTPRHGNRDTPRTDGERVR